MDRSAPDPVNWLPWRARALVDRARRRIVLDRAVRRLRRERSVDRMTPDLARQLSYGWGNESWAAKPGFLLAVAREAAATEGPILECGSGLTTLVLGIEATARGLRSVSLEHQHDWARQVRRHLARYAVRGADVATVRLAPFPDFDWYDPPEDVLPESISLVVCDGPPEGVRGGRTGLVPILRHRLRSGCVILLDDLERDSERRILDAWRRPLDATVEIHGDADRHARIVVGAGH